MAQKEEVDKSMDDTIFGQKIQQAEDVLARSQWQTPDD